MSEVKIRKNFGWGITERKMILFMPNYKNSELTEYSIRRISTVLEPKDWAIIIGNDNVHKDWSFLRDIEGLNQTYFFTLEHDGPSPRNGAFIRNYFIKRCRSEFLFQKDGEVVIEGDFLFNAHQTCFSDMLWRAGNIAVLNANDTKTYQERHTLLGLEPTIEKRIEPVFPCSAFELKQHLLYMNGRVNFTSFFHYGFCARTKLLQDMHGYDEDFLYYGFEDSDLFCRIVAKGKKFKPDYGCYAIHQWHPPTENKNMLPEMGEIFKRKSLWEIRNPNGWGEGI